MQPRPSYFGVFAGLAGFLGLVLGALAAHKAQDAYAAGLLREASYYQLIHCVMILMLCNRQALMARISCVLFSAGILLFCGGLASKALVGATFFTILIPFGGSCLMLGWLAAAVYYLKPRGELQP